MMPFDPPEGTVLTYHHHQVVQLFVYNLYDRTRVHSPAQICTVLLQIHCNANSITSQQHTFMHTAKFKQSARYRQQPAHCNVKKP